MTLGSSAASDGSMPGEAAALRNEGSARILAGEDVGLDSRHGGSGAQGDGEVVQSEEDHSRSAPGNSLGSAAGVWAHALENLRGAEESRRALEELLSGDGTVFVDERAFRSIAANADVAQQLKAQQRRIESLQQQLGAAVTAAQDAKASLRASEQARASLQERLRQVEKELETTSGVFEVYTSELRARQLEVETRCKEVRVLQGIVRSLGGGKDEQGGEGIRATER